MPSCNDLYRMVQAFYDTTGQARPAIPTAMRAERRGQMIQYLLSEIVEFGETTNIYDQTCEALDLLHFVLDIFVELGIDPTEPFKFVHEANMSKVWLDGSTHWDHSVIPARLLKPEGWESPRQYIVKYVRDLIRSSE